jgi:hypothetical protein
MRLSMTMRVGCLVLAAWLAGASGLLGCAYAMAADPAVSGACHQGLPTEAAGQAGAHDCCDLPTGEGPGQPEKSQFKECCFRVTPATVGKGKPPEMTVVANERLAPCIEPAIFCHRGDGAGAILDDSSGAYLLNRVLRI